MRVEMILCMIASAGFGWQALGCLQKSFRVLLSLSVSTNSIFIRLAILAQDWEFVPSLPTLLLAKASAG